MSDVDTTRDAVENAIAEALRPTGEMVTKWVALIETVGDDGTRGIWFLGNDGATAWDNLGMLTWAAQKEQARASRLLGDSSE